MEQRINVQKDVYIVESISNTATNARTIKSVLMGIALILVLLNTTKTNLGNVRDVIRFA